MTEEELIQRIKRLRAELRRPDLKGVERADKDARIKVYIRQLEAKRNGAWTTDKEMFD